MKHTGTDELPTFTALIPVRKGKSLHFLYNLSYLYFLRSFLSYSFSSFLPPLYFKTVWVNTKDVVTVQ
jgi:hypothetical protein